MGITPAQPQLKSAVVDAALNFPRHWSIPTAHYTLGMSVHCDDTVDNWVAARRTLHGEIDMSNTL